VDGESGVLIPDPKDLGAFGRAVTELLEDPRARARMASAGRRVYGDGSAARRIVDVLIADTAAVGGARAARKARGS